MLPPETERSHIEQNLFFFAMHIEQNHVMGRWLRQPMIGLQQWLMARLDGGAM